MVARLAVKATSKPLNSLNPLHNQMCPIFEVQPAEPSILFSWFIANLGFPPCAANQP